jgi:hypothetical protein
VGQADEHVRLFLAQSVCRVARDRDDETLLPTHKQGRDVEADFDLILYRDGLPVSSPACRPCCFLGHRESHGLSGERRQIGSGRRDDYARRTDLYAVEFARCEELVCFRPADSGIGSPFLWAPTGLVRTSVGRLGKPISSSYHFRPPLLVDILIVYGLGQATHLSRCVCCQKRETMRPGLVSNV